MAQSSLSLSAAARPRLSKKWTLGRRQALHGGGHTAAGSRPRRGAARASEARQPVGPPPFHCRPGPRGSKRAGPGRERSCWGAVSSGESRPADGSLPPPPDSRPLARLECVNKGARERGPAAPAPHASILDLSLGALPLPPPALTLLPQLRQRPRESYGATGDGSRRAGAKPGQNEQAVVLGAAPQ